eukprot:SAG31_NODE_1469_length_8221_cov_3.165230_2_plen_1723_part_00
MVFTSENWSIAQQLHITPVPNQVAEDQKTYILDCVVVSSDPNYNGPNVEIPRAIGVIVEDDDQAGFVVSTALIAVTESQPARYNITMLSQPIDSNVMISVQVSGGQFSVSPSFLSFGDGNWSLPQEIEVQAEAYMWGASMDQWSTNVTHTVLTSEHSYGSTSIPDAIVYVQPREGCSVDDVTLALVGPGPADSVVAGQQATFDINLTDSSGRTCVNSPDLIAVHITLQDPFDHPPEDIETHNSPAIRIHSNGVLTVIYRVNAFTAYNLEFYKGASTGNLWPATDFPGDNPRVLHTVERPPPQAVAFFTNRLDRIAINFDEPVYGIADHEQNCGVWFTPTSSEMLGTGARCVWNSPQLMMIDLGIGTTLRVGSALAFEQFMVRSYNSLFLDAPVTVSRADSPRSPTAVLIAPVRQGSCGILLVDATASYTGRPQHLEFLWSISPTGVNSAIDAAIRDANDANSPRVNVDGAQLSTGAEGTYNVGVQVTDSHGNTSYTYQTIQLDPRPIPAVTIMGPKRITAHASESLSFRGTVSYEGCTQFPTDLSWQLLSNGVEYTTSSALSAIGQHVSIPKHSLHPGVYEITFIATSTSSELQMQRSNYDTLHLEVVQSELESVIAGPRIVQHEVHADNVGEDVIIDGRRSFDPDMPPCCSFDAEAAVDCSTVCTELGYIWTCTVDGEECDGIVPPDPHSAQWIVLDSLQRGNDYIFGLTVFDISDPRRRSQPSTQIVSIVNDNRFAISCVTTPTITDKVDASNHLIFTAAVGAEDTVDQWEWNLISENMLPFPVSVQWMIQDSSSNGHMLILRRNVLEPGHAYTFRVQAVSGGIMHGTHDTVIEVNAGPQNKFDALTISPENGRSLSTVFSFDAGLHWLDDDLPIRFAFGYDMNGVHMLTSASAVHTAHSYLPHGHPSANYVLHVVCIAYDNLGTSTQSDSAVARVTRPATTVVGLSSLVDDRLAEAVSAQDVELLLQTILATGYALNDLELEGTDASKIALRHLAVNALYEAEGFLPGSRPFVQRLSTCVAEIVTPGITAETIDKSLRILARSYAMSFTTSGRRLQSGQRGFGDTFDLATAQTVLAASNSLYDAIRHEDNHTFVVEAKIALTSLVLEAASSSKLNDPPVVDPFVWSGDFYSISAAKRTTDPQTGAVTVTKDDFGVTVQPMDRTGGLMLSEVIVCAMVWADNPYQFLQTQNLVSPVLTIGVLSVPHSDVYTWRINLTIANVEPLPLHDHPLSSYALVKWDTVSAEWTQGGVLIPTTAATNMLSFAVSSYERSGDFAVQAQIPCTGAFSACESDCSNKTYRVDYPGSGGGVDCDYADGYQDFCLPGEGSCPPNINCLGNWTACEANCVPAVFEVMTFASGTGRACEFEHNSTRPCNHGDGACLNQACLGAFTSCDASCTKSYLIQQGKLGIGAQCPYADGHEEPCQDGDCKTFTIRLNEEEQDNVILVVAIILGSSCLLLGIGLFFCVRNRRTSLSGPTSQGQKNTQGFYSQTVEPQPSVPNRQQQQIISSQSVPVENSTHANVEPTLDQVVQRLDETERREWRPQTPSNYRIESSTEDNSQERTLLTPRLVSRPSTRSAVKSDEDVRALAKRYVNLTRKTSNLRATTPSPQRQSSRDVAEDFRAKVGESREMTTIDHRTREWVDQSQDTTHGEGLSSASTQPARLKVKKLGSSRSTLDVVAQAQQLMAKNRLRRPTTPTPRRNIVKAQTRVTSQAIAADE